MARHRACEGQGREKRKSGGKWRERKLLREGHDKITEGSSVVMTEGVYILP